MEFLHNTFRLGLPCLLLLGAGENPFTPSAQAQSFNDRPIGTPSFSPARISKSELPIIDGDLSDPIWQNAAILDQFYQVNPVEGGAPSEATQVRIIYSQDHLYIAATMHDRSPDQITARAMTRDTGVESDDYFQIIIDSYNSQRDGQFFMVSPTGARRDGLTENNRKYAPEWDTIWSAKTKITDAGWTAEIAIPFRSFSYDENVEGWGFQIRRNIARRNEQIVWSQFTQDLPDYDVSSIGRLEGIEETQKGRGIDLQGFVTAQSSYDWESQTWSEELEPSANLFYKFTPSLTGTITLNTDFSDTPLDPRQVNTDRFSLFFPETREFFLQDQSLFSFGGRPFRSSNGVPFFSRRIGLLGGLPQDIDYGAKLSGSVGPFNIGALTTQTADGDGVEGQALSVLRASADVGDGSRVGMIVTDGNPYGGEDNRVWGLDGQYKTTALIPGKNLVADAYYLNSESDTQENSGDSYGFEIAYPNDRVNWFVRAKHLDEGYDPALGFTNRNGIRDYDAQYRYRRRQQGTSVRYDSYGVFGGLTTDISGETQSGQTGVYVQRVWQNGSNGIGFLFRDKEVLTSTFNLPGGASVPAGEYEWNRYSGRYDTGSSRNWRLSAELELGNWYDGDRHILDIDAEFRPSRFLSLTGGYTQNDISVSGGDVQIKVLSADITVNFTPDMQFSSQVQYDNISEGLGYFGRFRWAIRPETELLITSSHGAQVDFDAFRSVQSGLSVRLGNTFRF